MSKFRPGDRVVHRLTGQKMLVTSETSHGVYVAFADERGARITDVISPVELGSDPDPSGVHGALEAARERAVVGQEFEVAAAIRRVIEDYLKQKGAG